MSTFVITEVEVSFRNEEVSARFLGGSGVVEVVLERMKNLHRLLELALVEGFLCPGTQGLRFGRVDTRLVEFQQVFLVFTVVA